MEFLANIGVGARKSATTKDGPTFGGLSASQWKMLPFRLLRRSPFLSAVAITSLALGIGANITVYSIVRELILDDVTARQPNRLAYINADVPPSLESTDI
jgi:hypothetical protein